MYNKITSFMLLTCAIAFAAPETNTQTTTTEQNVATEPIATQKAQEPAAPVEAAAQTEQQVQTEQAANAQPTPVAPQSAQEPATPVEAVSATQTEQQIQTEQAANAQPAPVQTTDIVAPTAVRGGESAAPTQASTQVADPNVMVAPKSVRNNPEPTTTIYYEKVYAPEGHTQVRTVKVTQHETDESVTMDELMGLFPMTFKIGAHATIGGYQILGNDWDEDRYDGITWKAGLMSIIPLNQYTMGIKVGLLYEQSKASETYYINRVPTSFTFRQKKLDIPVMFSFKAASSRIYFDLGVQMSIPIYDKLKVSYTEINDNKSTKHSSRMDLIDTDYRNTLDWGFIFGISVMANKYVSIDLYADIGLSDMYDGHMDYMNMDLSSSSFNIGLTLYPF